MKRILVVSGAAGTGKSTVCAAFASRLTGVCALDGDLIASSHADWDYDEYWSYVAHIANGIVANGLRPAICGVGLPEQVVPAAEAAGFRVRMLALVCEDSARRARIEDRPQQRALRYPAKHQAIDTALRAARVSPPHELKLLDTTTLKAQQTIAAALNWASR